MLESNSGNGSVRLKDQSTKIRPQFAGLMCAVWYLAQRDRQTAPLWRALAMESDGERWRAMEREIRK